jgi:hypothetical protein
VHDRASDVQADAGSTVLRREVHVVDRADQLSQDARSLS